MWTGVSSLLLTFPEFFQLVVSLFHIPFRDLLLEITHASGYYGAWPGQAVSISSSPNRSVPHWSLAQSGILAQSTTLDSLHHPDLKPHNPDWNLNPLSFN